MLKQMMNGIDNEAGVTQVIVVFAMIALLGASALVIDAGAMMAKRIQFSNTVDAATLAGVMELPTQPNKAIQLAGEYVVANGFDLVDVTISVGDNDRSLTVVGNRRHDFYIAPILGIRETTLTVRAKAKIGPSKSATGVRPFGIDNQNLIYGDQVVLKEGGGDGENGNFGAVAFDDSFGASTFRYNILYGHNGEIEIGDIIDTEPGNMASSISTVNEVLGSEPYARFDNYNPDSERVWIIPVLDDMDVSGRDAVTVVGFAAFFIEEIKKNAGEAEVTGRFIEFTTSGEISDTAPDIGVYAMKLIE